MEGKGYAVQVEVRDLYYFLTYIYSMGAAALFLFHLAAPPPPVSRFFFVIAIESLTLTLEFQLQYDEAIQAADRDSGVVSGGSDLCEGVSRQADGFDCAV